MSKDRPTSLAEISIKEQIDARSDNLVELCVIDSERGCLSTGEKRNWLMDMAMGTYLVFVDDDDEVQPNYVSKIMQSLGKAGFDCITFDMLMVGIGEPWWVMSHRMHATPKMEDHKGTIFCMHTDVVKARIATSVRFPHISEGEDIQWARQIDPLLKTEYHINEILYLYKYVPKKFTGIHPSAVEIINVGTRRQPPTESTHSSSHAQEGN